MTLLCERLQPFRRIGVAAEERSCFPTAHTSVTSVRGQCMRDACRFLQFPTPATDRLLYVSSQSIVGLVTILPKAQ